MDTSFKDSLSTRTKNALKGCYGPEGLDHPEIIAAGRERLKIARNIGAGGLKEIAKELHKLGLIDNPVSWLGG